MNRRVSKIINTISKHNKPLKKELKRAFKLVNVVDKESTIKNMQKMAKLLEEDRKENVTQNTKNGKN